MSKPFKLAILRIRHNPNYQYIPDNACLSMIMTGQQSLLRYWSDTTHDYFDFVGSAMKKWVDVTLSPPATDRGTQAKVAVAAVRAANPGFDPLSGFDGVLVLTLPGGQWENGALKGWDGGSGKLADGRRFSAIPIIPSTSVFMAHELGHTLGFDHSYGIDNNGTDWDPTDATIILGPEYGSPHDIMSAESFGTRWLGTGPFWSGNPTFQGPNVANWPAPAGRWRGPHLSRANLHRWFPAAFGANRARERPFPAPGQVGRVRLYPPKFPSGPNLLILHPPGEPPSGAGRIYVEYRPPRDWDIGLNMDGADLAQAGLVIHSLETISPGKEHVWYRGGIPMNGIDFDFQLPGSQLTITLEAFQNDSGGCWADIAYALGSTRAISILASKPNDTPLGETGSKQGRTLCGEATTLITWASSTDQNFSVSTLGFGGSVLPAKPPKIAWKVGGKTITGPNGKVDVDFSGSTFTLEYQIDPITSQLVLTSRGGEQVNAAVEATATEAAGGGSASASSMFTAVGWFDEYTPDSVAAMARCILKLSKYVDMRPRKIGPPRPDPVELLDPVVIRRFARSILAAGVVLHPNAQIVVSRLTKFKG